MIWFKLIMSCSIWSDQFPYKLRSMICQVARSVWCGLMQREVVDTVFSGMAMTQDGNLITPGIYVLQMSVEADTGIDTKQTLISFAY